MDELYDIRTDPYEMKNLIAAEKTQGERKKMKNELTVLLEQTGGK